MSKAKGWMTFLSEVRTLADWDLTDDQVKVAMKGYINNQTPEKVVEGFVAQ